MVRKPPAPVRRLARPFSGASLRRLPCPTTHPVFAPAWRLVPVPTIGRVAGGSVPLARGLGPLPRLGLRRRHAAARCCLTADLGPLWPRVPRAAGRRLSGVQHPSPSPRPLCRCGSGAVGTGPPLSVRVIGQDKALASLPPSVGGVPPSVAPLPPSVAAPIQTSGGRSCPGLSWADPPHAAAAQPAQGVGSPIRRAHAAAVRPRHAHGPSRALLPGVVRVTPVVCRPVTTPMQPLPAALARQGNPVTAAACGRAA